MSNRKNQNVSDDDEEEEAKLTISSTNTHPPLEATMFKGDLIIVVSHKRSKWLDKKNKTKNCAIDTNNN